MSLNSAAGGGKMGERAQLVGGIKRTGYNAGGAFHGGDIESSRIPPNEAPEESHEEKLSSDADTLKAGVFGALDGILTSFAIVSGAAGGGLGTSVVLILGVSNIIADGLSMGLGEYLSSKAMNEYIHIERQREEWELKNHRQGEVDDMVKLYTERGMSHEDAKEVLGRLSKYDRFFVNAMMAEELGMSTYAAPLDEGGSIREGLAMFLSFALCGTLPLLGYALSPLLFADASLDKLYLVSIIITSLSLFLVGVIKSMFIRRSWYAAGLETLILGGCCAGLAYEIGSLVALWTDGMSD